MRWAGTGREGSCDKISASFSGCIPSEEGPNSMVRWVYKMTYFRGVWSRDGTSALGPRQKDDSTLEVSRHGVEQHTLVRYSRLFWYPESKFGFRIRLRRLDATRSFRILGRSFENIPLIIPFGGDINRGSKRLESAPQENGSIKVQFHVLEAASSYESAKERGRQERPSISYLLLGCIPGSDIEGRRYEERVKVIKSLETA
jgi:hypothetical protein